MGAYGGVAVTVGGLTAIGFPFVYCHPRLCGKRWAAYPSLPLAGTGGLSTLPSPG